MRSVAICGQYIPSLILRLLRQRLAKEELRRDNEESKKITSYIQIEKRSNRIGGSGGRLGLLHRQPTQRKEQHQQNALKICPKLPIGAIVSLRILLRPMTE